MLIPVDADVSVPVTVVVLGEAVTVLSGTLVRLEQERLHLALPAHGLAPGARLVVTLRDRTRLTGKVLRCDGDRLLVSRDGAHAVDDRAAPRVKGPLALRWRPAGDEAAAWLAGGADPGPFVGWRGEAELSVSGMLLPVGSGPPPVGARVLIELALDGGPPARALAVVRRVVRKQAEVLAGVEFAELPERTLEALSAFTLAHL